MGVTVTQLLALRELWNVLALGTAAVAERSHQIRAMLHSRPEGRGRQTRLSTRGSLQALLAPQPPAPGDTSTHFQHAQTRALGPKARQPNSGGKKDLVCESLRKLNYLHRTEYKPYFHT